MQARLKIYRNTSIFMILVILGAHWGFYKNYISQFPDFINKTTAIHVHGALWMSWLCLLVIQPFLIRTGRIQLHRTIGKVAYVHGPLLILFLFIAGKESYWRIMDSAGEREALMFIVLDSRGLFSFTVFWALAMLYRKDAFAHMRYMIATGILAIGPGVGRGLVNSFGFDFGTVFESLDLLNLAIVGYLLGFDWYNKKNYKPFLVVLILFLIGALLWQLRNSDAWHSVAKIYAAMFY
jgi:hypothetical protein